jgi:hypothetical protein
MEIEFKEKVGCSNQNLLSLPKSNHLKLRLKPLRVKENLTLNLNILVMLNVSGVRNLDITLQSVQIRE